MSNGAVSRTSDAVRLAVGTFTAVPVPPPSRVDRDVAGLALVLAPLAVLPIGLLVAVAAWTAREIALPSIVVGAVAIGVGALGTRAIHLDGLADTVDALTASYDRERALAVARTGDVGPAGAAALVLVLLIQSGAAGAVAYADWGPLWIALAWCLARAAATVGARRGVPAAHADGLGRSVAESLHPIVPALVWLVVMAALGALTWTQTGNAWGLIGASAAYAATVAIVDRSVRRLGGIIGDVLGASVEVALAFLLIGLAAAVGLDG